MDDKSNISEPLLNLTEYDFKNIDLYIKSITSENAQQLIIDINDFVAELKLANTAD